MNRIIIAGGRVLDPETKRDEICDILIENGAIKAIGKNLSVTDCERIEAGGCYVMPGLIDLHVHLRDPGMTYKEDIGSGSLAAAHGGFTTILAMPNTKPVADCADVIQYVQNTAKQKAPIHVLQVGAVTKGMQGKELAPIGEMVKAGCAALSEDGKSVMNAELLREAMQQCVQYNIPMLSHCEDINLVHGGIMNQDGKADQLGLPGITNQVEDVIVARDILLAKETGARLHLCHCSTKDSVRMVRMAVDDGIDVSAEVCPHHFTLTTDDIPSDDGMYKMNPPLRRASDRDALRQGLSDGTMGVISTDHAPHAIEEKQGGMKRAAFGVVGLETSVALTMTELVHTGLLTPLAMADRMSYRPACVIRSDRGRLQEGRPADITIIDPDAEYRIDADHFLSKGRNTPFDKRKVKGKVIATICDGAVVWREKNDQ